MAADSFLAPCIAQGGAPRTGQGSKAAHGVPWTLPWYVLVLSPGPACSAQVVPSQACTQVFKSTFFFKSPAASTLLHCSAWPAFSSSPCRLVSYCRAALCSPALHYILKCCIMDIILVGCVCVYHPRVTCVKQVYGSVPVCECSMRFLWQRG